MARDDEDTGWAWASGPEPAAPARGRSLLLLLLAILVVVAVAVGGAVQTARVDRLSTALSAAHVTATAQARALATARSGAIATATAAAKARRRPPVSLALPPEVARPACTAVARTQEIVRTVLHGVKGADAVVDVAARALRAACAASIRGP